MRLVGIILCFVIFSSNLFAQKKVLLEKYTSAFCGACPNGHLIAESIKDDYPDNLILAFHHSSVDGMANANSTEWKNDFEVPGTPMAIIDRTAPAGQAIPVFSGAWEARVVERFSLPKTTNIELEGSYDPASRFLSLDVGVDFLSPPEDGDLRLNLMVLEDSVIQSGLGFDQSNYYNEVEGHPLYGLGQPIYFYPHHHVVRDIVDDTWGTSGVFPDLPEAGIVYTHQYEYELSADWADEFVKLVVFVSLFDEEALEQREVLDVVELSLSELIPNAAEGVNAAKKKLKVFPNPSSGQLRIETPAGYTRLALFDATGRMVLQLPDTTYPSIQLNLSAIGKGVYVLRAYTTEGIQSQRIIVY
jgi:hypothetical protein